MVNEEKVKIMTGLAIYEKHDGKKQLPISRYYRTDYVGQALIRNLFLVTLGYGLIVARLGIYYSEYLMENIHKMNLPNLGIYLIAGYFIILIAFSVLVALIYTVKYYRAKKSVRGYYDQLTSLDKFYAREEKKKRNTAGGEKS